MALRFRKSFKLAPGVRLNIGKSSVSLGIGPRGSSVSIGTRGTFLNSGIPGTGLSVRQRLGGRPRQRARRQAAMGEMRLRVAFDVSRDGSLALQNPDGTPLEPRLEREVRRQHGNLIREVLEKRCAEINREIEAVGELYLTTPEPGRKPTYEERKFSVGAPTPPAARVPRFPGRLFKRVRDRVSRENAQAEGRFKEALEQWEAEKGSFERAERRRRDLIEREIYSNVPAMEEFLEQRLQGITWPRETLISATVVDGGRAVFVDVDLPEIEDMPSQTATVGARLNKLSLKELSPAAIQRLYMRHVHGIGFRLIGETFAALPKAEEVVLSGFSQRADPATGQIGDEYLYSVRVKREAWSRIDFANLSMIDVVESLASFELRRSMTKSGRFKPIEPFAPAVSAV